MAILSDGQRELMKSMARHHAADGDDAWYRIAKRAAQCDARSLTLFGWMDVQEGRFHARLTPSGRRFAASMIWVDGLAQK